MPASQSCAAGSLKGNRMSEVEVSQTPVSVAEPMVPTGGGSWRLACKLGVLYGFARKGNPLRIKQADQQMDPIELYKVGGCSMRGIKSLRFLAKRISTGEGVNFEIVITDVTRPEFSFLMILQSNVVIELSWDGVAIKSEVLGKLDTLLTAKPGKLKPTAPMPPVVKKEWISESFINVHKHQRVGEKHPTHRSLVLFNDGKNMYSKSGDVHSQLFFQMYYKETLANSVPGANFLESTVLFKTFGHTINGSVIVMLREKYNNWCLTVAIAAGQTLAIDDHHHAMSVKKI